MKKRKPPRTSAKLRELATAEAKMLASHTKPLELGAKAKGIKAQPQVTTYVTPPQTKKLTVAEFKRKYQGGAHQAEAQAYTGTEIVGIATMHKSAIVPIFSKQEADDVAHMRR